ncbi:MAG: type II toxin-antitoxin system PemK/MazF family toxin [Prevotellaceae bacterium]|jgi:mRNA interferase MazF|nr:type II toxin-antitoxin system PemK/MazF family toxin [Prevotellaceae bacterium]
MGREQVKQFGIFWVILDPTLGSEIAKTRPCVVVSPDEMNENLRTIIVAPLTSTKKDSYPFRADCMVSGRAGSIALDQIRTIDKKRIGNYMGTLNASEITRVKEILQEMFA